MRATTKLILPVMGALLGASLVSVSSGATPAARDLSADRGLRPGHVMPRHDLIGMTTNARSAPTANYRYSEGAQFYPKGSRPRGLSAMFTVHLPKDVRWRRGDHSLAEIALARPGSNRSAPSYIETGWYRGNGNKHTRLFVFWWGLKGNPHCYNFGCGFHRKGKGKRPGSVLKPGSHIRLAWIHKHHRWNLYVNKKMSGYYPDKLWKGKFTRVAWAQVFGEVATLGKRGSCTDMGNGRYAGKQHSARIWQVKLFGTSIAPDLRRGNVTRPKQYTFKRLTPTAFRYGGPGAC